MFLAASGGDVIIDKS